MTKLAPVFACWLACSLFPHAAGAQNQASTMRVYSEDLADFSAFVQDPSPGMKSETTALMWSLLGTAVPAIAASYDVYRTNSSDSPLPGVVLVGALLIGPSLGHFYSSRSGRAGTGIGIRALSAGAGLVGYVYFHGLDASAGENSSPALGEGLLAGGLLIAGASIAWDIIRAPHSARVQNALTRETGSTVGISPSLDVAGLGLRVAVRF